MRKKDLKDLAQLLVADEKVSTRTAEYVLTHLNTKDLKDLLFSLKMESQKRRVVIKTAEEPEAELREKLTKSFEGKTINWEEDLELGGGIVIEDGDDTMDFSVKSLIKKTIDELKSN